MTVFLRLLESAVDEKPAAMRDAVAALRELEGVRERRPTNVFQLDASDFPLIPGSPFAYWVSESLRGAFRSFTRFEAEDRTVKQGLATADDYRFVRAWWEVAPERLGTYWFPFAKGGAYSPFYADVHLCIYWSDDGAEILSFPKSFVRSPGHYFRPGLTWPLRTQRGFGIRTLPVGSVFGHKGPAAFSSDDYPGQLLALLSVTTSATFCYLVELQMAFGSYEVGVIQRTPVPRLTDSDAIDLARLGRRAWSLKRSLDTTNETSHAFLLPPGLNESVTGLDPAGVEQELGRIQEEIDEHAFRLYQIGEEDRAAIEAFSQRGAADSDSEAEAGGSDDEEEELTGEEAVQGGAPAETVLSWLVGVAFGRFDPRLATGERPVPPEPEPFDPLPARSPGMYPEGEEPAGLPDILVGDEGHADDLTARVRTLADQVQVETPVDLRGWLAKEFFPLHIRMYSKSRRKAPLYWQLATASASYSVWLYIHAFSRDTLYRVQNDYAAPKLAHEERRLDALAGELRDGGTAEQRRAFAAQEAFVEELRLFLDEVKRAAPLWNPDLDDGVLINFAPLWRLVPQLKAWQRELKATWDALCAGKYDWAHLAMHLWPERVVPKCARDRSLAIAHGLEEIFWVEGEDGKWTARKAPTRPAAELIEERTSPAVKEALANLLAAPPPAGTARARWRRQTK